MASQYYGFSIIKVQIITMRYSEYVYLTVEGVEPFPQSNDKENPSLKIQVAKGFGKEWCERMGIDISDAEEVSLP